MLLLECELGRIKVELEIDVELGNRIPGLAMGISSDLASPKTFSFLLDRRQENAMDVL